MPKSDHALRNGILITILGLIIIPYNVWLVMQVFDLRERVSLVEDRQVQIGNMDAKIDVLVQDVSFIKGQLSPPETKD